SCPGCVVVLTASISPERESRSVQIAITCRHGKITDEVRDSITEKSQKLLTLFERVTAIQVTVDFEKDRALVEILVDAEHKHNFVAQATEDQVMAAFDQSLHKMEQQIRRYKEKIQDHRRDRPLAELGKPEAEEEA